MSAFREVDVMIIGAGPTGLMLANALARMHIRVEILDKREAHELFGQADGIQPRTLETWSSYGMIRPLIDQGYKMDLFASWTSHSEPHCLKRRTIDSNVKVTDARYNFEVTADIRVIESILRKSLSDHGIEVTQPWNPCSLTVTCECVGPQCSDASHFPVQVLLEQCHGIHVEKSHVIRAKYLIGCDGSKSWVRQKAGISMVEMDDSTLRSITTWGVVDFTPVGNFPDVLVKNIVTTSTGLSIGWIPRPNGTARVYLPLGDQDDNFSCGRDAMLDTVRRIITKVFCPYVVELTDITWANTYRVRRQLANRYCRPGHRIIIAGDACHTHSPMAGQGANLGMGDAHNLGWKLAYILRGWAKTSLLSTYEDERRDVATTVIRLDLKILAALEEHQDHSEDEYLTTIYRENRLLTGIGIQYTSRLTASGNEKLVSNLTLGERVPPCTVIRASDGRPVELQDILVFDGAFVLLIFPGDLTSLDAKGSLLRFISSFHDNREYGLKKNMMKTLRPLVISNNVVEDGELKNMLGLLESTVTSCMNAGKGAHSVLWGAPKAYATFGIADSAAILVRPDGYMSLVSTIDSNGQNRVIAFLTSL